MPSDANMTSVWLYADLVLVREEDQAGPRRYLSAPRQQTPQPQASYSRAGSHSRNSLPDCSHGLLPGQ